MLLRFGRLVALSLILVWFLAPMAMFIGALETRSDALRAMLTVFSFLVSLYLIAWSPLSWKGWALLACVVGVVVITFVDPSSKVPRIEPFAKVPDGACAVVTGGSKGIGLALVRLLLSEYGFTTVVVVSRSAPPKEEGIVWVQADLADPGSISKIVESIKRVDLFISNAALGAGNSQADANGFPKLLRVNVLYQVKLLHALLDMIKESPLGRIVFVSSDGHHFADYSKLANLTAPMPNPVWILDLRSYGKTKALQVAYARALAMDGWNSVSVHPGFIASEIATIDYAETFGSDVSMSKMVLFIDGLDWFASVTSQVLRSMVKIIGESTEKGARRVVHAALHRGVVAGSYVAHCRPDEFMNDALKNDDLIKRVQEAIDEAIKLL